MVVSPGCLKAIVFVILRFHSVSLQKVWYLPYTTHCFSLPILGQCLLIFDVICRRLANFIHSCIVHKSILIRSVALYVTEPWETSQDEGNMNEEEEPDVTEKDLLER